VILAPAGLVDTCVQAPPATAVAAKVAVVMAVLPAQVGDWSVPAFGFTQTGASFTPISKEWLFSPAFPVLRAIVPVLVLLSISVVPAPVGEKAVQVAKTPEPNAVLTLIT